MVFSNAKFSFTLKRQFRSEVANNLVEKKLNDKYRASLPAANPSQMSTIGPAVHVNKIMRRKDTATELYINNDPIVKNGVPVTIRKQKL
jgi:hypothetical protein